MSLSINRAPKLLFRNVKRINLAPKVSSVPIVKPTVRYLTKASTPVKRVDMGLLLYPSVVRGAVCTLRKVCRSTFAPASVSSYTNYCSPGRSTHSLSTLPVRPNHHQPERSHPLILAGKRQRALDGTRATCWNQHLLGVGSFSSSRSVTTTPGKDSEHVRDEIPPPQTAADELSCWKCDSSLDDGALRCTCGAPQPLDGRLDYFEILGCPRSVFVDMKELEGNFKRIQRAFHPVSYFRLSRVKFMSVATIASDIL